MKGVCSCGESYIRKTVRSVEVHWNEHKNPIEMSNLWKQVKDNVEHAFQWSVIAKVPTCMFQRKVLEEYYIVLERPTLNEQLERNRLNLF